MPFWNVTARRATAPERRGAGAVDSRRLEGELAGAVALAADGHRDRLGAAGRDVVRHVDRVDPGVGDRARRQRLDRHRNPVGGEVSHAGTDVARGRMTVAEQHDARHVLGRELPACGIERRFEIAGRAVGAIGRRRVRARLRQLPQRRRRRHRGGALAERDDAGVRGLQRGVELVDLGRRCLDRMAGHAVRDVDGVDDRLVRRRARDDRPRQSERERHHQQRARRRLRESLPRIEVRPGNEMRQPDERHAEQEPEGLRRAKRQRHGFQFTRDSGRSGPGLRIRDQPWD